MLPLFTWYFGSPVIASETRFDGTVIFLRHALAPGHGDPRNFDLNDCRTQRNLDETGRRQARAIGKRIAAARLSLAGIYSSEWCRCLETALLLDLGAITPFEGLNSFYQNHAPQDATLAKLTSKLDSLPRDGATVIMGNNDYMHNYAYNIGGNRPCEDFTEAFFNSPNTTNAVIYKVQCRITNGHFTFNGRGGETNAGKDSYLIATEIAQ